MAKLRDNRIRERRLALGIKQEDLAKAVKMSVSTINRLERNKGDAKASTLYDIANESCSNPRPSVWDSFFILAFPFPD